MNRKRIIIGILLVGLTLAFSSYAWAGGGHHRGRYKHHHHRIGHHHKKHHMHGCQRFHHKRFHRHHAKRHHRHGRRPVVVKQVNNYYGGGTYPYPVRDDYRAFIAITDNFFGFSIGVSGAH